MSRRYKGSMTVEAAVVVPIIIFIITAVIYLCFFLHDRTVLQSYSLREAEKVVWQSEKQEKPPVYMVQYQVQEEESQWLMDVLDVLGSRKHADVSVSGTMRTKGSEMMTGGLWQMGKKMRAVRVNYVQDRLVTTILKKEKG